MTLQGGRSLPLKHLALFTLVVQNSLLVIVLRYSRLLPGPQYFTTTAVLLSEISKFLVSLFLCVNEESEKLRSSLPSGIPRRSLYIYIRKNVFAPDLWKMFIPSALYTVQNNLQYVAVGILDPTTFQVTYQLKILTTALFSVVILNRTLSRRKWFSLVLLTFGVALVQLPEPHPSAPADTIATSDTEGQAPDSTTTELLYAQQTDNQLMGLLAVGMACLLSGLAGVYFEKVLKGTEASIWVRNTQLSLFSIPFALLAIYTQHGQGVIDNGFFHGYNFTTFAAIACQAGGGIIVALVVKYADNIIKGFATSLSIILSCIASVFLFCFRVTWVFVIGGALVIYATYLYGVPDVPEAKSSSTSKLILLSVGIDPMAAKISPNDTSDTGKGHKSGPSTISS